jgi:molybdate transport system ATP-binding protein
MTFKQNIIDEANFNSPLGVGGSVLSIHIERSMLTSEGKNLLKVDLEIANNELLCLFGHSGAGKTTLLRILAGLFKSDKGFISFNGQVWFDSAKKINLTPQQRNVGYMFQDYALFPNMSVRRNIEFAQKAKNSEEVNNLLNHFGLDALQKQYPAKLSGGQKQRVALARALAAKPNLLLLDEPLSALDEEMRQNLQDEILKAHAMLNSVTLLVSHDKDEVRKLASSVALLRNGAVVNRGKPSDVF